LGDRWFRFALGIPGSERWRLGYLCGGDSLEGGLDPAGLLVAPLRLLLQGLQDDLIQAHVDLNLLGWRLERLAG
jgi:hypothetical protein